MDNDISNNEIQRNKYIDKITMELLMSKSKYNKYLESKEPEKYAEKTLYKKEIFKYRTIIQDIIDEEFNNISTEANSRTTNIKRVFDELMNECIQYIKMKEIEIENPFNHDKFDDNEHIFEKCDDIEEKLKDINNSNFTIDSDGEDNPIQRTNSLWGDGAIKYDMKMFSRRKR